MERINDPSVMAATTFAAPAASTPASSSPSPSTSSPWGSASSRSCYGLIDRLERNDPTLVDVVILPSKTFGPADVERLAALLERGIPSSGGGDGDSDEGRQKAVATDGGRGTDEGSASSSSYRPYHWRSLSASSHPLPPASLARLGRAIATSSLRREGPVLVGLAVGDETTGDDGMRALCRDGFMMATWMPNEPVGGIVDDEGNGAAMPSCSLSLEWLDVSRKGMTGRGFADLVACLCGSRRLRRLNLGHNDFSRAFRDVDPLGRERDPATSSGGWFPALEELDLSHCQLEPEFVDEFLRRLRPPPDASLGTELRLDVAGNPSLTDAGFQSLWNAHGDRLVELDVSGCGLGDAAVELLVCGDSHDGDDKEGEKCFAPPRPLRILNVSDNSIGPIGGASLGRALRRGSLAHLMELHLARNQLLGPDGVTAIADGLKYRQQQPQVVEAPAPMARLLLLDMSATGCDPASALHAIQNSGVETLLLHGNQLGADGFGFEVLARGLRGGHATTRYLDLSQNGATERSVVALLDSLAATEGPDDREYDDDDDDDGLPLPSVLTTVVVGGNGVGPDVDASVARAQARHPALVVPRR